MENTVVEALNTIGAAVGIPAALLIGWLFLSVRSNSQRIDALEKARESDRKDQDSKLSEIYNKLNMLSVGLNEFHVNHLESWQQPVSIKCRIFSKNNFYFCKNCFMRGGLEDALEAPQIVAHLGV